MNKMFTKGLNLNNLLFWGILLQIGWVNMLSAQNHASTEKSIENTSIAEKKLIAFGETLKLNDVSEKTTWTINRLGSDNIPITGTGAALNDYVFAIPGNYEILIHENLDHQPGECEHRHLPEKISLEVSRVRMVFNTQAIVFSNEIRRGVDTKGITMAVPITIQTYDKQPVAFNQALVNTAGVGTNITATLSEPKIFQDGNFTLVYNLQGIASEQAYIMFDFVDVNGQVQAYAHLKQIK